MSASPAIPTSREFLDNPSLFPDVIIPEDREVWDGHDHDSRMEREFRRVQFRIRTRDGNIRWIEHVCRPVINEHGEFQGIRASNRDLTERKDAEFDAQWHREELAHVTRIVTIGELATSLAHEINQPLTAFRCNAEAAQRFLAGAAPDLNEVRTVLDDIIQDDGRAGEVIRRIRALVKKEPLYAFTSTIWPSVTTFLLLIVLAVYSGRRRSVPGALPFLIASLFAAASAASSVMEYAAMEVASKIFWVKFQGIWHLPIVTASTCFLLEYTWPGRWLTRRNLVMLSIVCFLGFGLILTNDLHHLLWQGFAFQGSVQPQYGPGGWFLVAYAFGALGVLNLIVCGWLFLRSMPQRWPVAIVMVGQLGGRLLHQDE